MQKVRVLGIEIDNLSQEELLKKLEFGGVVFTPNVDHLMKLQKDTNFYETYKAATYKVCDSQILLYAARFLGLPLQEKISGSDLFPAFYNYYKNNEEIKIFLLGAAEGVAKKAQENINRQVGRQIIVDSLSPSFGFEKNEQECRAIIERINRSGATVLAVGVGAPKQENWICKYKDQFTHIKTFLAIGATIDFEADPSMRAPRWMSEVGLEWLFRILVEPKRLWKRYVIEDVPFLGLVLKQKLNLYQHPFASLESSKSLPLREPAIKSAPAKI